MGYTQPHGQPQGLPISTVNKIRESLIAETVAINGYANHIANSDMDEINIIWRNIMIDEKEHYGLFLELIRKYDPEEYEMYIKHKNDNISVTAMQKYQPNYDKQIILNNVREDIKGELEAIILYEQINSEIPYQDAKEVFHHVIRDEKEHTEHLTAVLLKYDSDKYNDLM